MKSLLLLLLFFFFFYLLLLLLYSVMSAVWSVTFFMFMTWFMTFVFIVIVIIIIIIGCVTTMPMWAVVWAEGRCTVFIIYITISTFICSFLNMAFVLIIVIVIGRVDNLKLGIFVCKFITCKHCRRIILSMMNIAGCCIWTKSTIFSTCNIILVIIMLRSSM